MSDTLAAFFCLGFVGFDLGFACFAYLCVLWENLCALCVLKIPLTAEPAKVYVKFEKDESDTEGTI